MTHPRRTFMDVTQILRDWIDDSDATIRRSTHREHLTDAAMQAHVRELKRNLPKAKKALRELT